MSGTIQWKARKVVGRKQEAWYDRATWTVPFLGTFDHNAVAAAIRAKVSHAFCELSEVRLASPGVIEFDTLYKIGD